ncbi:MAG: hypothetical protein WAL50_20625 [Kineosporiaceae bacterium]
MRLVLDAGALIGIDRHDRHVAGLIELGRRAGAELVTAAPAVGQAWRDGARQANLARALPLMDVRPCDLGDARAAGELLGAVAGSDVIDALVALLALPGDQILTSDPTDVSVLIGARGVAAHVVRV